MTDRLQRDTGHNLPRRNGAGKAFNFAEMVSWFAKVRARLVEIAGDRGRREYYRALWDAGARHSNELRSASRARKIYLELAATVDRWEVRPPAAAQGAFEFAAAGQQPQAAEHRCKSSGNHQRFKPKPRTKEERFQQHDADHPEVYEEFVSVTREVIAQGGGRKFGARFIWERMRWMCKFERPAGERYTLNDVYIRSYSEKAMANETDLRGCFNLRSPPKP